VICSVLSSSGGGEDVSQPGICQGSPYLGPVKMFPHSKEEEMSPNLGSVSGSPYLELVCGLGGGCCQGCEAWQPVVRGGDQVTRACVPVVLTAIFSLFFQIFSINFFKFFSVVGILGIRALRGETCIMSGSLAYLNPKQGGSSELQIRVGWVKLIQPVAIAVTAVFG